MKQRPGRKNFHKERILSTKHNKVNFDFQRTHQSENANMIHEGCMKNDSVFHEKQRKGSHVA